MENGSVFMYLSVIEGLLIVCMLGWEIFWLRKMYQVLWRMPTSDQIGKMVEMISKDRDAIKDSLNSVVKAFEPLKNMLNGMNGGVLGTITGLFGGGVKVVGGSESSENKQEH
jgi:hypothetical protein